uniref:Protein RFT1 homolog n=1 Tax=Coccolithus braarudii TaxID=221442 RepID=A0A7S0LII3_9EUKA|mmetsp:Transcript_42249/g.90149  ORF Transcript_42249/g.90149 Transcript_42249/m.90149 type:complete len:356 (+) Transcript_42249:25-1092(+)
MSATIAMLVFLVQSAHALTAALVGRSPLLSATPRCTAVRVGISRRLCSMQALASAGDGGGDGIGGGGIGDGGSAWGSDGESEDNGEDAAALLSNKGIDPESLPDDLLRAVREGRIGSTEMDNWLAVCSSPLARSLSAIGFVRNRLLAEPRLLPVLGIELGLGCTCTMLADRAARGAQFLPEFDFVLANQVLIALTNTALVFALCPAAPVGKPGTGAASALLSSLPGYFMQGGAFSPMQRAMCFGYKAAFFAAVGVGTSAAGQATTMGLIRLRGLLQPGSGPQVELAPISETAANYALFMSVSSNTRYQLVNSFEGRLLGLLPPRSRSLVSVGVRTYNNYLGSANWIWWARRRGLQ